MRFLRNAWYVAAWSDEIGTGLFARRLLDEPLLFYRDRSDRLVALADRCPHRFVPLHLGKRHGDAIECAYHGLRFGANGDCVLNPNSEIIPAAAKVRAYPVIERHRLVFAWMGDPAKADAATIPKLEFLDDESLAFAKGYIHGRSSYMLMVDNILDLSHAQYLHADTLGSEALARAVPDISEHESHIDVRRWMPDSLQAPLTAASRGFAGRKADAWTDTRWFPPSYMHMETCLSEPGRPRSEGKVSHAAHLITPETATTNHYFWANARAYRTDDEALTQRIQQEFGRAFEEEDKPILEAQQQSMGDGDFWALKPILLRGDAPAVRVRRRLDNMLIAEQGAAP